jgi:hypothetical protein
VSHDLTAEVPLVLVKDIPKVSIIPTRRGGGRTHQRTGFRWALQGLSGVRLETVLIGGNRYTSVPALERFFAAVTAAKQHLGGAGTIPPARGASPGGAADVEAELDRVGL